MQISMEDYRWKSKRTGSLMRLFVVLIAVIFVNSFSYCLADNNEDIDPEQPLLGDLIRSRGFIAEKHQLTTKDGYIITLYRILNPYFKKNFKIRRPILFLPGESTTGGLFIVNSKNARPKDFSNIDVGNLTQSELYEMFKREPSARTLALLASNFARDVWLGSRRGYPYSREQVNSSETAFFKRTEKVGQIGKVVTTCCLSGNSNREENCDPINSLRLIMNEYQKTVNPLYWNFNLDNVANTDVEAQMNYVLAATGRSKIDLVGHSTGSAISLMALSNKSELQDKVSNLVLYSPTIYQSNYSQLDAKAVRPAIEDYIGPFSVPAATIQVECLVKRSCKLRFGNERDENGTLVAERCMEPETIYRHQNGYPVGSRSLIQLVQNMGRKMHYFDHGPSKNKVIYGQPEPPEYKVGVITKPKISVYYGGLDPKITYEGGHQLVRDIGAPVDLHYFGDPALEFSHLSPLISKNVTGLVVLPSLVQIQTS